LDVGEFALSSLLLLALVAAAAEPTPARGDLQMLFTGDDYPLVALRNDEQGSVTVKLRIDHSGLVSSCKVIKSSRSRSLDEQTCAVLRARAQFEPAKDARGRPTEDQHVQTITWRIAGGPVTMPRHAWMTRTTLTIGQMGNIIGCNAEATGLGAPPQDCEIIEALQAAQGQDEEASAEMAGKAITEIYFYPVDPSDAPTAPRLADARQIAQQISRIAIDRDGKVSACQGIRYSGEASPEMDACRFIESSRFDVATGSEGLLVGTMVITAYMRTRSIA
jgi:TonB family protein